MAGTTPPRGSRAIEAPVETVNLIILVAFLSLPVSSLLWHGAQFLYPALRVLFLLPDLSLLAYQMPQLDASIPEASDNADDVCPSCRSRGKRNLVICIDGTSNQFGVQNTNVVELYSRLIKDEGQLTFYNSGIGTYARPSWRSWGYLKQVADNKLDLAIAFRFENIMLSAYAWLVDNYQEGDRVFMFGFSRGAYQYLTLTLTHADYRSDFSTREMTDRFLLPTSCMPRPKDHLRGGSRQLRQTRRRGRLLKQFSPEMAHSSAPETCFWASRNGHAFSQLRSRANRLAGRGFGMCARLLDSHILRRAWTSVSTRAAGVSNRLSRPLLDIASRSTSAFAQRAAPTASRVRAMLLNWARTIFRLGPPKDTTRPFPRPPQASPDSDDQVQPTSPNAMQERFKRTFSRDVKPHFIGAWDTVSSVGFIRDKTLPGTTDGMSHVCFFRHALAMHERRVKFLPEYVNGGAGPSAESTERQKGHAQPHTKEVWFTGSHSDIGGGNVANASLDKFGPALRWMSFEAVLAGLRIENGPQKWEETPRVTESMTWPWKLVECLPVKRLSYVDKYSVISWPPHLGCQRIILPNQLVHESVFTGMKDAKEALSKFKQEDDAFTAAQALLTLPDNSSEKRAWVARLRTLMQSQSGIQSLIDLIGPVERLLVSMIVRSLRDGDHEGIKGDLSLLQGVVLRRSLEEAKDWATEINRHSKSFPLGFYGHSDIVHSVAFVGTGICVSGSWDGTLRLWNIVTGEALGATAPDQRAGINCVAVSPNGSIIASGSGDGRIRTWTLLEDKIVPTGVIMRVDSRQYVSSLAFLPDGSRLISGDAGGEVRVWDATSGQPIGNPVRAHSEQEAVWATFSPDGARIASSSSDSTVQLRDAQTLELLHTHTHSSSVLSVAFSPDGTTISHGGSETGICICRADTLEPTSAVTGDGKASGVLSVAFSRSGRYIAAGCCDAAVRIWDVSTGQVVGVLKGHTSPIWSVAFSPDGTRIVSGSDDHSIRVWDRLPITDQGST